MLKENNFEQRISYTGKMIIKHESKTKISSGIKRYFQKLFSRKALFDKTLEGCIAAREMNLKKQ